MAAHKKKSKTELIYDANKKRIRTEGSILLAELMNEALDVMTEKFEEAKQNGGVLELDGNRGKLKEYLWEASKRTLSETKSLFPELK